MKQNECPECGGFFEDEYDNIIQTLEYIEWNATNFNDIELMQAIDGLFKRGLSAQQITQHLQQLNQ